MDSGTIQKFGGIVDKWNHHLRDNHNHEVIVKHSWGVGGCGALWCNILIILFGSCLCYMNSFLLFYYYYFWLQVLKVPFI